MLINSLIAFFVIFCALAGWIGVQHLARSFATRHPEFGPVREDGKGCGGLFCLCRDKLACPRKRLAQTTGRGEISLKSNPDPGIAHSNPQENKP